LKKNLDQRHYVDLFYSLDGDKNLMVCFLTKITEDVTTLSYLREPVTLDKEGLILPESAFTLDKKLSRDHVGDWDFIL
jgi:hypothetical protein